MFDINAIITQALNAAVQQATVPLLERIVVMEFCNAEQHQRLRVLEGALTDRVSALEDQAIVTSNRINDRIDASSMQGGLTRDQVEALIEKWMDDHTSQYDHDSYDDATAKVEEVDFDDFVTNDSIEDAVRDAVGNLSFEVSVS